jgi:hypothetical protein
MVVVRGYVQLNDKVSGGMTASGEGLAGNPYRMPPAGAIYNRHCRKLILANVLGFIFYAVISPETVPVITMH